MTARARALQQQPAGTFTPVQVAKLYDFPAAADGSGQCIAIIELGGGFRARDVKSYFKSALKITPPKVVAISVDQGHNKPTGDPSGPDGEVMLDIEVAGAVAPKSTLAVYFAPNTDQGFYDAIAAAVHDTRYNPSVISISWGGPESSWTQQSLTEFNTLLEDAATLGLTVCVASGDNGSTDGLTDGLQHVDFPSSSPFALACGGTKLSAANGNYGNEVVWNEIANQEGSTGGGVSDFFAKPAYQADAPNLKVPASKNPGNFVGRGVPDVSGDADPVSGYDVTSMDKPPLSEARAPLLLFGRPHRLYQSIGRQTRWVAYVARLLPSRAHKRYLPRHHQWQQRLLRGRARVGCLHWLGNTHRLGDHCGLAGKAAAAKP